MKITRDRPEFRPVTIRLETQDELDKLIAIVASVAENRINHIQQVMRAAIDIRDTLINAIERE